MLLQRTLVALVLLPVGIAIIVWGGLAYAALIAIILGIAALEFVNLFRAGELQPSREIVFLGVILLVVGRVWNGFTSAPWIVSLVLLAAMIYHLVAFEHGRNHAGTDFGITVTGAFYIGWLGAYLISLRNLDEGLWWVLTVLPAVWWADTGAYFIGSRIGRHKMTPRLSPKKSWEGYLGGVIVSTLGTALLTLLWGIWTGPNTAVTPVRGAALGFLIGALTIFGDLGVSMIKRQVSIKDSGNILPGHGGIFDRIDSWLWAVVIGYYMIVWLF